MRRVRSTAIVLALLLLAPAAIAWSSKGENEPNTAADKDWQWDHPTWSPGVKRVYFNGFPTEGLGVGTSVNPNAAGTRMEPDPIQPAALLGEWVDCNEDGFIGDGWTGALEYPASIGVNLTLCPMGTSPDGLVHNDGTWIQEFWPIGYDDVRSPGQNPFALADQSARVWADWGAPDTPPAPTCGGLAPPQGSMRSTGALLGAVDCRTGHEGLAAFDSAVHGTVLAGLSFGDAPADRPERSRSPLNKANPWGDDGDASTATVVDCTQPSTDASPRDPTDHGDGDGRLHEVNVLGIPVGLTDDQGRFVNVSLHALAPGVAVAGSPAGTVNETQAETSDCDRNDANSTLTYDGERRGSDGDAPYALESSDDVVHAGDLRHQSDFAFTFEMGARRPDPTTAQLLGARWQNDAGTQLASTVGMWVATQAEQHVPAAGRGDALTSGSQYLTFYAHVGTNLTAAGFLAKEPALGAQYALDPAAYVQDASRWWVNSAGASTMPRDARLASDPSNPALPSDDAASALGVLPGQPYEFRDVDCYLAPLRLGASCS